MRRPTTSKRVTISIKTKCIRRRTLLHTSSLGNLLCTYFPSRSSSASNLYLFISDYLDVLHPSYSSPFTITRVHSYRYILLACLHSPSIYPRDCYPFLGSLFPHPPLQRPPSSSTDSLRMTYFFSLLFS